MNNAAKDVSLFEKFKDPDEAAEAGHSVYLIDTDTGKWIDAQMEDIRRLCANHFDMDMSPLWPKLGETFNTEFFETRYLGHGDDCIDEFVLVWRDVAITYYKRFGRSTYISRELSSKEATQFIEEIKVAIDSIIPAAVLVTPNTFPQVSEQRPLTPGEVAKQAADLEKANRLIAAHDVDPVTNYTLRERRIIMAEKLGYIPTLRDLVTPKQVNDTLDVLKEEGIPTTRPQSNVLPGVK